MVSRLQLFLGDSPCPRVPALGYCVSMRWIGRWAIAAMLGSGVSCVDPAGMQFEGSEGGADDDFGESSGDADSSGAPSPDVPVEDATPRPASLPCQPIDPEVTTDPQTIEEAIELINALPKPLTVGCFVESLSRPLAVNGTTSVFSAQPAAGDQNPRLFLMRGNLVISVVPGGTAQPLVEFGEFTGDTQTQTLKGELHFPIEGPLTTFDPFEQVLFREGEASVCGFCHSGEHPSPTIDGAFVSDALRPAYWTVVDLEWLEYLWRSCDEALEPDRCAILDGVFGRGEVHDEAFDPNLPAFFE